ncbi:unnamed protein product [Moneuplotes crassus]|uniref:Uncharacterized protein n=2 Tax=Euplotes crassus TaxID=5936 RepID=A0AAD1U4B5_EUPCR|nr:unnamed protein product [Moneuplotes crassus]
MLLRGLNNRFTHGALKGRNHLLKATQATSTVSGSGNVGRPYFTFMDKVKEAVRVPVKHMESFFESGGHDYESQLPNTENLYGNTAMVFNAYLTHNAIDMNTWHDMDKTYHNQFGTVDNPVLIFTTDSSWRIVICQGPGVEDDSHAHEKMFYFVREGPMNRCHICGQCFKLVRLKDEYSEVNDYYSFMFSSLSHFDISEEDAVIPTKQMFGDRPSSNLQSAAGKNVYIHVNPDEADHMLVDPAYKMEKLEEAYEKLEALFMAFQRVERESGPAVATPVATSKNLYSNWFDIEKSIRELDRMFVKVEKFEARLFIDPDNHDRREQRMLARKRDRWTDNYTYFFGGLTEEEQMYRDYFQTDLEEHPEDAVEDAFIDELDIASQGEFKFENYEFIESSVGEDPHDPLVDLIDSKIFKYQYRVNNDSMQDYIRRMDRVVSRQLERASRRDPAVNKNLHDIFEEGDRERTLGAQIYKLVKGQAADGKVAQETKAIRDYMYEESLHQYKDYFESDDEEADFFEYMEELPARDRIKLIEIFEDYTVPKKDGKGYVKIPRREYNPELSFFSNAALDLADFRDRVLPLAQDAARLDGTFKYQRVTEHEPQKVLQQRREYMNKFLEGHGQPVVEFGGDTLTSEELLSSDEFTQTSEQAQKVHDVEDVDDKSVESSHDEAEEYESISEQSHSDESDGSSDSSSSSSSSSDRSG